MDYDVQTSTTITIKTQETNSYLSLIFRVSGEVLTLEDST